MSVTLFLRANIEPTTGTEVEYFDIENSENIYFLLANGYTNRHKINLNFSEILTPEELKVIEITNDLGAGDDWEDEEGNAIKVEYNWVWSEEYTPVLKKVRIALFENVSKLIKDYDWSGETVKEIRERKNFCINHLRLIYDLASLEYYLQLANSRKRKIAFTLMDI